MTLKLNSLLGRCQHIAKTFRVICEETFKVFKNHSAFRSLAKVYTPLDENGIARPDLESVTPMVTTVKDRLSYTFETLVELLDVETSREATNQVAIAKIILGGKEFILSGTALLCLEKRIKEMREMFALIPTLDHTVVWTYDGNAGVYSAPDKISFITDKKNVHLPFQAADGKTLQVVSEVQETRVGRLASLIKSGEFSSAQKATILSNCEELLERIISARHEANYTYAVMIKVGDQVVLDLMEGTANA